MTAVHGDDRGLLLEVLVGDRPGLVGAGDPLAARARAAEASRGPFAWVTLPRLGAGPVGVQGEPTHEGARHAVADDVAPALADGWGLVPASAWDRFATTTAPPGEDHPQVRRLDPAVQAGLIRGVLAEANPGTSADPTAAHEAAWFGAWSAGELVGVIGAGERSGDPGDGDLAWHLHGLGVRPRWRGAGLGAALTAAITRAGFAAGADWVSLGMYADNAPARRVYRRLGFAVEGRFTSYRPPATVARP